MRKGRAWQQLLRNRSSWGKKERNSRIPWSVKCQSHYEILNSVRKLVTPNCTGNRSTTRRCSAAKGTWGFPLCLLRSVGNLFIYLTGKRPGARQSYRCCRCSLTSQNSLILCRQTDMLQIPLRKSSDTEPRALPSSWLYFRVKPVPAPAFVCAPLPQSRPGDGRALEFEQMLIPRLKHPLYCL